MAQDGNTIGGAPQPSPGVMYRETDFIGNAKHSALPLEHPDRQEKGDIGFADLEPPAPLGRHNQGTPYILKR